MTTSIRALTFSVFGTLLANQHTLPWMDDSFGGADWTQLPPRPGVVDALKRLGANYKLAPLSNTNGNTIHLVSKHFGLPWSAIIDTEMSGAFKPDERVYRHGLLRLGLRAEQVLHVTAHKLDLEGAKAVGLRTAYLTWPGYSDGEARGPGLIDYTADGLEELADVLLEQG